MFTPEFFIEAMQSVKRTVFHRIVSDPDLRQVGDRYINTQTEFAKMLVENSIAMVKYSLDRIRPRKEEKVAAPYKVESSTEKAANTDTQGE